jgi:hypothetical protein
MQPSQSPHFSQISILQTLAPRARGLGGQGAGTMRQMAEDHFHPMKIETKAVMNPVRRSTWLSWALVVVNVPAIGLFLYFASWIWAPRGQEGLYYDAGDSVAWGLTAFPILLVSTLTNIVMSRSIFVQLFYYKNWRPFLLWLVIVVVWVAAFKYDSGRHFDGSRMSTEDSGSL